MKSKNIKLELIGDRIQIDIPEPQAGDLSLSSHPVAVEYGTVIAVGPDVTKVKEGDKVFYKGWSVDIVVHEGKKYFFTLERTGGICAIIK